MNLLQLRKKFVQLSGRYDLISGVSGYTDSGANFFIQAGQRFLERMRHMKDAKAKYFKDVSAGAYYAAVQNMRVLHDVWASEYNGSGRTQLEYITAETMRAMYTKSASSIDQGTPLYYSEVNLRTSPTTSATSAIVLDKIGGVEVRASSALGLQYSYRGVMWYPPTDASFTIEINGIFRNPKLSADTDVNYWSEEVPETLLKASLYEMEVFYRNTEGANDWYRALTFDVDELDKDEVEATSYHINQMEG